jgi:hypothetical protein
MSDKKSASGSLRSALFVRQLNCCVSSFDTAVHPAVNEREMSCKLRTPCQSSGLRGGTVETPVLLGCDSESPGNWPPDF